MLGKTYFSFVIKSYIEVVTQVQNKRKKRSE